MGFLEALSWAKDLGLNKLIVEGDSKIVVDAILHNNDVISTFGDYTRSCKLVLSNFSNFSVHFVRLNANALAHNFARVSRNHESSAL